MSLQEAIVSFTGIESALVADVITGIVFACGILLIVSLLSKFIFRFV